MKFSILNRKKTNFFNRTARNFLLSVFSLLLLTAATASAATLTVTKTANDSDGACNADCSLLEAIIAAAPGDEIVFASPLFDTPQIISLTTGQLGISKNLTITGKGANLLTIRRPANAGRLNIFNISGGATVVLSGMTLSDGYSAGSGGAINVLGNSSLTINYCHLTNNTAAGTGGGIAVGLGSTLVLNNSAVTNNTAPSTQFGGGGGIYNQGTLTVNNSTVSGNSVTSGNFNGGGIFSNTGTATITNSTITDNQAIGTNSAGGIYLNGNSLTVRSSIVAGNRNNTLIPDIDRGSGTIISGGFNIIGSVRAGIGFTDGANSDKVGTISSPLDPRLDVLGNYGGATPTHRLQLNSPAVDAGKSFGATTDQRGAGFTRPIDRATVPNAAGGDGADSGAFELFIVLTVTKTEDTKDGACNSDCSLREAIIAADNGTVIEFASPLFDTARTITLSDAAGFQELQIIDKSITIAGRGANLLTINRVSNSPYRLFVIGNNASAPVNVNLTGMTVSGGQGGANGGGAIYFYGSENTLTVAKSHLTGNRSGGNANGGALQSSGRLFISNSTVSNNQATAFSDSTSSAGGIYSGGSVFVMTNSTVSGNVVRNINGSTGGNFNAGGIYSATNGIVTISNSTITDNEAVGANSAGGIIGDVNTTVRSTIIAGNRNNSTTPDVANSFTSGGYNLIGNVGSVTDFTNAGDRTGTGGAPLNPLLGALAANGGTTPTHAVLRGSPAIDSGNSFGLSVDQRGSPRPIDNPAAPPAPGGDNSDTGAYEAARFAPLVVTKTADTNDGSCDSADCSLREAIAAAGGRGTEIVFSSLFNTPQTITLSDAAGFQTLSITDKSLTITGTGANLLTVRRDPASNNLFGIFAVSGNNSNDKPAVTVNGMTVTGGRIVNGGGGITVVQAALNVTTCQITDNASTLGNALGGGGIYAGIGSVLTVSGSTVSNNLVLNTNSTESGGGIKSIGESFVLIDSTVSGNSVGGGTSNGGGIYADSPNNVITNSTITDNEASGTDTASGVYGNGSATTVSNTIIARNRSNTSAPDVLSYTAGFNSQGFNLIGVAPSGSGFTNGVSNDRVGTSASPANPLLAPLAMNGGTTFTHALLNGSEAINNGTSAGASAADQRGAARSGAVDIGAYESNPSYIAVLPNATLQQSYSQIISPNNGTATFVVVSGSLPPGISLTSTAFAPNAVVALAGTPTASGTYNFAIRTTVGSDIVTNSYQINVLAPTAAVVTVSGRILTPKGIGLRNALVTLTDTAGNQKTILSTKLGGFRFSNVPAGETYIISVASRRYIFQSQVINVSEDIDDFVITAIPKSDCLLF